MSAYVLFRARGDIIDPFSSAEVDSVTAGDNKSDGRTVELPGLTT